MYNNIVVWIPKVVNSTCKFSGSLLSVWRDVPFYTNRERAALEWTEAVTLVSESHVPDDVYSRVMEQFAESELTNLTLAIVIAILIVSDVSEVAEAKRKPRQDDQH